MKPRLFSNIDITVFVAVLILFLIPFNALKAQSGDGTSFRIMFYNAENFFDVLDDTLKDDEEFLPKGVMRWNSTRFNRKLSSVSKTIVAAGGWEPPGVVSFCEIENRYVLERLIYGTGLANFNYRIIHEDSPDPRGIDVCMIYRADRIKMLDHSYWIPELKLNETFRSRSVLYAKCLTGEDTLHLIINHWPSRRGGVLSAEDLRRRMSQMVSMKIDSINSSVKGMAKILLMGDFNCTPEDPMIKELMKMTLTGQSCVNLSNSFTAGGYGTYRYQGRWEVIDQAIVSPSLINAEKGISTDKESAKVFSEDFLLMRDPNYPGLTPMGTYRGFRYQGGFSDHLPVLIDMVIR